MNALRIFVVLSLLFAEIYFAQRKKMGAYENDRREYAHLKVNDATAMPKVEEVIALAKKRDDLEELAWAYEDAVIYHPHSKEKLKYADSMVEVANRTANKDLVSHAYLTKGLVFFRQNQFPLALNEYLKAQIASAKTNNLYLQNKVLFNLGTVRMYLENYTEAQKYLEKCSHYFYCESILKSPPDVVYRAKKGYYHSIYQLSRAYLYLGKIEEADSLIILGEKGTENWEDFRKERAFFYHMRGISDLSKKKYEWSTENLKIAASEMIVLKDSTAIASVYFFLGENAWEQGAKKDALSYWTKVDSLYTKYGYTFPELHRNYKMLLQKARQDKDEVAAGRYAEILQNLNDTQSKNKNSILRRIDQDETRERLQRSNASLRNLTYILISLFILSGCLFIWVKYRKRTLTSPIAGMVSVINSEPSEGHSLPEKKEVLEGESSPQRQGTIPEAVRQKIEGHIKQFESSKKFMKKGIVIENLAKEWNTNKQYLSLYINEVKGTNFSSYLSELRINEIVRLLNEEPKYRKYTIVALAQEGGFGTRSNFSEVFLKQMGMRPQKYIHDLQNQTLPNSPPPEGCL